MDLGKQLKFPDHIVTTKLRPDVVIHSDMNKQIIILELTCPWEENIAVAHERKSGKYQELIESCQNKGWTTISFAIEIGVRGFLNRRICSALSQLGITGANKKRAIKVIAETIENASKWIWAKRAGEWGR